MMNLKGEKLKRGGAGNGDVVRRGIDVDKKFMVIGMARRSTKMTHVNESTHRSRHYNYC